MKHRANIHGLLAALAAREADFLRAEFLAPVIPGAKVGVRLAGVRCALRVEPAGFGGWGVFRPESHTLARLVRGAGLAERAAYLRLFPAVSLVLCARDGGGAPGAGWLAVPANAADGRFSAAGLLPLCSAGAGLGDAVADVSGDASLDLFETVRARFDGARFWFEAADERADPAAAAYLRDELARSADPAGVGRPGLLPGQRRAYAAHVLRRREQEAAEARRREDADRRVRLDARTASERRLRAALAHARAELHDFADRGDVYRVSYVVDGRRHSSVVRKGDLTVQTAGICLSGGDRHFDLSSLVGVIREGQSEGSIVRVS